MILAGYEQRMYSISGVHECGSLTGHEDKMETLWEVGVSVSP